MKLFHRSKRPPGRRHPTRRLSFEEFEPRQLLSALGLSVPGVGYSSPPAIIAQSSAELPQSQSGLAVPGAAASSNVAAILAPDNFSGTAISTTQLSVSWTAASGATGYSLYELENGQPVLINTYSSSTTSATISGLAPATAYEFSLVTTDGTSTAATPWISAATAGGAAAAESFTGSAISTTQVGLSWAAAGGATGYSLYKLENGQPVLINTYSSSITSATISGLAPASAYEFDLVAFNASASAATPWTSATTTGGVSAPAFPIDAALSTSQIGLNWTAASGATGYNLYELENGQPVLIGTYSSSTTSATVSGLASATKYAFDLVAINGSASAATPWISATTTGGVSAPEDTVGTAVSTTQIGFTWTAVDGATGYSLYELESGQPVLIGTYSSATTAATVGYLAPGTTYAFNLVAFNPSAAAATPWISENTTAEVSAPDSFTGTALSTTQISLNWTAGSGATAYSLYELENGQPVLINTYSSATTSATISGLAAATTYQFNLVAFNSSAVAATSWIGATTAGGVSAPDSFTGTATSTTQLSLNWTAASGATGYSLYELESGQPVLINTYSSATTSATISGLAPATEYKFNLVAFNSHAVAATPWISVMTAGGVSAPDSFTGTALSTTQIGLVWTAASGATGYSLYELESGKPVLINTYTSATTSATISGLTPATTYAFNLVSFNANAAAATPWTSAATAGGVTAPDRFTGTATSTTQLSLNWTAASGATGYSLYELENGKPVLINSYAATTTSATISGLAPATAYAFNLVAFNASAVVATPWISAMTEGGVSAPDSFTGTATSTTQLSLNWTAASGATGYRLYEMENGKPVLINTYAATTTSVTISGLTPATGYQFNLVAFNANASAATPWISALTAGGVSAPDSFTGTVVSTTQIGLNWTVANGATGYNLYELQNGQPVLIDTYSAATASATISGLTPATKYQFNLVAFNTYATAATPWISATTAGGVSVPDGFAGSAMSTTQIGLSWAAASGATGYSLYELENGQPVLINTYASTITSATISGLSPATKYAFNLVAFNAYASAATPWISATTA